MSDKTEKLESYLDDCEQCAGRRPESFLCPILLDEAGDAELIDGHILPQSLRTAARATVLQRADLDNFYGHTVEPALIEFLNSVTYTKADFFERAKGVQIVSDKAGPLDLFVPSPKSKPPFPKLGLKDSKGATISSPHVKGTADDLGGVSGSAEVRGSMSFHKPSVDGAMLKSAHLALFRLSGYRWALSAPGRYVSDPLRRFFHSKGEQSDAEAIFGEFGNAVHVVLAQAFPFNTLADSTVLLHDQLDDPRSVDPFAISCIFVVNDRTLLVTLPFCLDDADFENRLEDYQRLMDNWQLDHRMVRATMSKTSIEPESILQMKYTETPPPELIPENRSDKD